MSGNANMTAVDWAEFAEGMAQARRTRKPPYIAWTYEKTDDTGELVEVVIARQARKDRQGSTGFYPTDDLDKAYAFPNKRTAKKMLKTHGYVIGQGDWQVAPLRARECARADMEMDATLWDEIYQHREAVND